MTPLLLAYLARAIVAALVARRAPTLRPLVAASAASALLAVVDAAGSPSWRAGAAVALPGVGLALAAWGVEREAARLVPDMPSGAGAAPIDVDAAPVALWKVAESPPDGWPIRRRMRELAAGFHPPTLPALLALGYLLTAALSAICYRSTHIIYALALPASRILPVALVALYLARRPLPRTWLARAACVPVVASVAGTVGGVWTLGGLPAIAAGWGLARAETWAALCVSVGAMWMAGREERIRRGA